MILKEHSLEMRGMPRRDLAEYFLLLGGKPVSSGMYVFPNWRVKLSDEQSHTLGSMRIPATLVTFQVNEEDWPEIQSAFRLRFLSAGG